MSLYISYNGFSSSNMTGSSKELPSLRDPLLTESPFVAGSSGEVVFSVSGSGVGSTLDYNTSILSQLAWDTAHTCVFWAFFFARLS